VEHEENIDETEQQIHEQFEDLEHQAEQLEEDDDQLGKNLEAAREDFGSKQESEDVPGAQQDDGSAGD
jgi:hypothetical protein